MQCCVVYVYNVALDALIRARRRRRRRLRDDEVTKPSSERQVRVEEALLQKAGDKDSPREARREEEETSMERAEYRGGRLREGDVTGRARRR